MKQPQVSVIIPTYNRSSYLEKCLDALLFLNTDLSIFEVVVVDNNSHDDTQKVVARFIEFYPELFCYVRET